MSGGPPPTPPPASQTGRPPPPPPRPAPKGSPAHTRPRHGVAGLGARLQRDERVPARQLAAGYESGPTDAVTVALEAKGFADLLERLYFLKRINQANVQVTEDVRRARQAVVREASRL